MTTLGEEIRLTKQEAYTFLKDILFISDPKSKMTEDPVAFLDLMLRKFHHHIPWNNIPNVACPPNERHVPTLAEMKKDVSCGIGGMCFTLNFFGLSLMRAVGYEADIVNTEVGPIVYGHPVLIAYNLAGPGSKHLIDFGSGGPQFSAISLDFEEFSPEYKESYLCYRFKREGDTIIRQHRADTDPMNAPFFKDYTYDGWMNYYVAHPNKPVEIDVYNQSLVIPYTTTDCNPCYLNFVYSFTFPNGRYVSIKNTTLLVEDEEGRMHKSYLRSRDEIISSFARYFPHIPEKLLETALDDEHVKLDYTKGLK